ncbi:MAG: hypothetical protein IKS77_00480 [Spirochaetales bacterium]|nr:hypothetical protein [Spirochaetales bacterium]
MEYASVELQLTEIPYKDFPSYNTDDIASRFKKVIEGEGPVVDDFLELKVLKSYGIFQRGSQIAPFLRKVLLSVGAVTTTQIDCDGSEHLVLWPERFRGHEAEIEALECDLFQDYRPSGKREDMKEGTFRSIADFPQIEVFNAMKEQLSDGTSLKKADLLTQTNHALGFLVKGRQIRETLEKVLKAAVANGSFVFNRRAGTVRQR